MKTFHHLLGSDTGGFAGVLVTDIDIGIGKSWVAGHLPTSRCGEVY